MITSNSIALTAKKNLSKQILTLLTGLSSERHDRASRPQVPEAPCSRDLLRMVILAGRMQTYTFFKSEDNCVIMRYLFLGHNEANQPSVYIYSFPPESPSPTPSRPGSSESPKPSSQGTAGCLLLSAVSGPILFAGGGQRCRGRGVCGAVGGIRRNTCTLAHVGLYISSEVGSP